MDLSYQIRSYISHHIVCLLYTSITGKDNHSLERSFDLMDKAAENESGTGAAFINAGLGFGASLNIGKHINPKHRYT